ncbi:MAG: hypothetical protein Q7S84_00220 [bacterium]|nr:hypothetical protein [bacterium]
MKEPGMPQIQEPGEDNRPVEGTVVDWSVMPRWKTAQEQRRITDESLEEAERDRKPPPTNGEEFAPDEVLKPPEVAEGIMEDVFRREVEEAEQAAAAGARRVFDAGGNAEEVHEAKEAGETFLSKFGVLVRKTVKEAAAETGAVVSEIFLPVTKAANWVADNLMKKQWWKEEDWSLPDEIRTTNEARINEKYAKYQEEEARRERTETAKPATVVAKIAATNVPAPMPPAESHYRNQLRENLDVQLRTLARTTDNPEEQQKLSEKITELEAAILAEGGEGSNKAEKSGTTAPIPETPYLAQLRENLDMQRRTLARITDNPEERARVETKIEELRQAIQQEAGGRPRVRGGCHPRQCRAGTFYA